MRYRRLGKTGLEVSVLGLGTWQFGGEWGKQFTAVEVEALVGAAKEHGVNLIDTAECYGDHLAESLIGQAIRDDRADWIVATKFGHNFHPDRIGTAGWSPEVRSDHWSPPEVLEQLDSSLKALGTDYVDVYQLHGGSDEEFDRSGLWEMLGEQVEKGKIRFLGISLGGSDNLYQTERANEVGSSVIRVTHNRFDRTAERRVFPACLERNLGVLAREPLANGYLGGKYKPGAWITASDDWRSAQDEQEVQDKLRAVQEIQRTEVPDGMPMAAWALAWCLRHPTVSAVIAGSRSVEQLQSNAAAADLELAPKEHPQAL
jgi:aryl-alcohol dehydrogenase-like predicted oxidoreductase